MSNGMRDKPYFGMCIGGPRAGQLVENVAPEFWAVEKYSPQADFFALNAHLAAETETATKVLYTYQPWGMGDFKAGVWVLEGASPLDTFNEILAGYARSLEDE